MNAPNLLFALVGALVLAAGPVAAQTEPGAPPSPVAPPAQPDADDQPGALPGVVAPKAPGTPDWTFEEVLGGEVTVGPEYSPVAMGIGAVAGVVAFNLLQQYVVPERQPAVADLPRRIRHRGQPHLCGGQCRRRCAGGAVRLRADVRRAVTRPHYSVPCRQ